MSPLIALNLVPVAAWLFLARTRVSRFTVTGLVLLWTAAAIVASFAYPRAFNEIAVLSLPIATAIVWVARFDQKWRLGKADIAWGTGILQTSVVLSVLLFACMPPVFLATNRTNYPITGAELLPMPAGLNATELKSRYTCPDGVCTTSFSITGTPGVSSKDLESQLRQHLRARGWDFPDGQNTSCRPIGLILDRRKVCVTLTPHTDEITALLSNPSPS